MEMGETYCTRDVVYVLKAGVEDVDAGYICRQRGGSGTVGCQEWIQRKDENQAVANWS